MARWNTIILNPGSFSNPVLFADGAAAAPSISFANDTNTGFYSGFADQVYFSSGGTAVEKFTTNGLVFASSQGVFWAGSTIDTAQDTSITRGAAATIYIANQTGTDNTGIIGDSTHRLSTVHTKSLTIGQSIANPVMGIVTLSGGTGTASVQTTSLASGDRIFLTHQNASGTTGTARVTSSTAGTGFTIVSSSSTDTSTIAWFIVKAS